MLTSPQEVAQDTVLGHAITSLLHPPQDQHQATSKPAGRSNGWG